MSKFQDGKLTGYGVAELPFEEVIANKIDLRKSVNNGLRIANSQLLTQHYPLRVMVVRDGPEAWLTIPLWRLAELLHYGRLALRRNRNV